MSDEPTYTLAGAAMELRRRECALHGHSWDVISTLAGPVAITCSNCGKHGSVTMDA